MREANDACPNHDWRFLRSVCSDDSAFESWQDIFYCTKCLVRRGVPRPIQDIDQ